MGVVVTQAKTSQLLGGRRYPLATLVVDGARYRYVTNGTALVIHRSADGFRSEPGEAQTARAFVISVIRERIPAKARTTTIKQLRKALGKTDRGVVDTCGGCGGTTRQAFADAGCQCSRCVCPQCVDGKWTIQPPIKEIEICGVLLNAHLIASALDVGGRCVGPLKAWAHTGGDVCLVLDSSAWRAVVMGLRSASGTKVRRFLP